VIRLRIDGEPVAKGRPRFARVGAGVRAFTPAATASYEERIGAAARAAAPAGPPDGPLRLELRAVWPALKGRPSGVTREAWAAGYPRQGRPDLDNVVKAAMDGLQRGGWLDDDARIVEIAASKAYAPRGSGGWLEISVGVVG